MLPTKVLPTLAPVTPEVTVVILYSAGSCGAASRYGFVDTALLLGLDVDSGAGVLVASREHLGSVSSTFRTPLKGKAS